MSGYGKDLCAALQYLLERFFKVSLILFKSPCVINIIKMEGGSEAVDCNLASGETGVAEAGTENNVRLPIPSSFW